MIKQERENRECNGVRIVGLSKTYKGKGGLCGGARDEEGISNKDI